MVTEMVPERLQIRWQSPGGAKGLGVQTFEDEPHRQVVEHGNRLGPAPVARVPVAPQPEAGPAR